MPRITILTLFPGLISDYLYHSGAGKFLDVELINIRDYSDRGQCDDYAYGGGTGLVMMVEPIVRALRDRNLPPESTFLMSPSGRTLTGNLSLELLSLDHIVLICGHYEGVDYRILNYIGGEISIGDYVLTSGELSAMVLMDNLLKFGFLRID